MGKKKVFLRGIDEELYAKVKARASLLGITVSEAVNLALETWLSISPIEAESPASGGKRIVHKERPGKGVLVVVNGGEIERVFENLDDAIGWLRDLYQQGILRNSTIRFLGVEEFPKFLEIGGGGIEIRREV